MKPQSEAFLERSRDLLQQAEKILNIDLAEVAGRTAYLAGYNAAQAFLFEHHSKVFKTHSGVRGEFGRLAKDDDRFDAELRTFLGHAYQLKSIADYGTGPDATVSRTQAVEAIGVARRLVDTIARVLEAGAP